MPSYYSLEAIDENLVVGYNDLRFRRNFNTLFLSITAGITFAETIRYLESSRVGTPAFLGICAISVVGAGLSRSRINAETSHLDQVSVELIRHGLSMAPAHLALENEVSLYDWAEDEEYMAQEGSEASGAVSTNLQD